MTCANPFVPWPLFSFGYVEFNSIEDAQSAISTMEGQELDGRFLRLDFAEPRGSTPGSGGGRGGSRGGRGGGRGGFGGRGGGRGEFICNFRVFYCTLR